MATLCPFYIDIQPDVARLQAVVDKLKSLGDTVLLAATKATPILPPLACIPSPGVVWHVLRTPGFPGVPVINVNSTNGSAGVP